MSIHRIYKELQTIEENEFRFREQVKALTYDIMGPVTGFFQYETQLFTAQVNVKKNSYLFQCEPYDYVEDLVENMQVYFL